MFRLWCHCLAEHGAERGIRPMSTLWSLLRILLVMGLALLILMMLASVLKH
jgi:hypothetical protein